MLTALSIPLSLVIALQVSFEKTMYSVEEGKVISEIRLTATEFVRPFSVQIFATTLDASRPEKENEATSGELCVPLVLQPGPVALCVELLICTHYHCNCYYHALSYLLCVKCEL